MLPETESNFRPSEERAAEQPWKGLHPVTEMCECPSQLPRTQPVHITAKRHKLGSQGMREVQMDFGRACPMRRTADQLQHEQHG
ncbi:uncharacterized protein V6R79_002031 [Siganus canaliculatus]